MVSLAFVTNGFEDAVELSHARPPPDSPAAQVPPAARTSGRAATAASAAVAAATTSTASAAAAEAGGHGVRALGPGRGRHPCRRHGTHLRLRPRLRARHGILQRVRSPPPRRRNGRCCSHRCGPGGSVGRACAPRAARARSSVGRACCSAAWRAATVAGLAVLGRLRRSKATCGPASTAANGSARRASTAAASASPLTRTLAGAATTPGRLGLPSRPNRTTTTTMCTRPSSGRPGSSTASCKPAGRSCRPACARGSFRAPFCGSAPPSLRPSTSARRATWTWAGASSRSGLIGLSGLDGLRIHLEHKGI